MRVRLVKRFVSFFDKTVFNKEIKGSSPIRVNKKIGALLMATGKFIEMIDTPRSGRPKKDLGATNETVAVEIIEDKQENEDEKD